MAKHKFTGMAGLPLSRRALRTLKERGIYAHSQLSVEHQQLAKRHVIRGLESGGCAGDVGRYVTFADEHGLPLEYLHPVEAIAVNGLHAVVISTAIVRVDMLRKGRTYELLITRHSLSSVPDGPQPQLETEILFRGFHGRLELDLSGKDKAQAGNMVPTFYSLAGEVTAIPEMFLPLVRATTIGANCTGCSHTHYLRRPRPPLSKPTRGELTTQDAVGGETTATLASAKESV
ncbi:MAG: hypothetical protein LAP86_10775 [Acidobacteriia bacterium]|nr:hypothetical protein [Terriglobia bacterium]